MTYYSVQSRTPPLTILNPCVIRADVKWAFNAVEGTMSVLMSVVQWITTLIQIQTTCLTTQCFGDFGLRPETNYWFLFWLNFVIGDWAGYKVMHCSHALVLLCFFFSLQGLFWPCTVICKLASSLWIKNLIKYSCVLFEMWYRAVLVFYIGPSA